MPVHDGVYYQFELENPQLSSACLTDPWVSHHSTTAFKMPSSNHGTGFKFRSRHESVDWRKIGAIDVDKVANDLDFYTLQDNIMNITYCSVENERCPHCKNSLDPILVKLFRLAQLLIEYLLHSQEYLTSCLQTLEQKVQIALKEKEEIQLKMAKQSEEVKKLKEECKHRKAMIATQQMMITSGANSYNKCHHCDKAFVNYSYLQGHMQRRHPEEARCEKSKSNTSDKLQQEMKLLKEELTFTKSQLEAEKAAQIERLSKMQENKERKAFEEDILKKFENWKAEEKEKSVNEMEKVKEMFMKEFKELSVKNSSLEDELRQLRKETLYCKSGVGVLQESPSGGKEQEKSNCSHDIGAVMELLHTQEQKLENKVLLLCQEHDKEKKQLICQMEKLKLSLSEEQRLKNDLSQKQMQELEQKILEQNKLIRSQKEQINKMTVKTSTSVPKHAVNVVSRPSVASQEDETKSYTVVARDVEIEKKTNTNQNFLNAIKKNKSLSKELRSIVEQGLNEKLEALGVKPGTRGISREDLSKTLSVIQSSREEKEKLLPEMTYYRSSLLRLANSKAEEQASSASCCKPPHASKLFTESEIPAFESPPSTLVPKKSRSKASVLKCPQDVFQTQPQSPVPIKSSTPKNKIVSVKDCRAAKRSSITTPPFSSDEEEEDMNGTPVQPFRSADFSKPKTLFDKKGSAGFPVNSDSEGSLLEEAEPQKEHKQSIQIQAPIKPARATLVRERTEQIVKQVASHSSENKPAGSVDVTRPFLKKDPVMEFRVDDIEDSDFDSFSLEEEAFEVPRSLNNRHNVAVHKKGFSPAPVKSAFGPAKANKPEAREADASSTLVSSLVSVSDFSDCSDI